MDFAPSTGKIFDVNIPSGPGVRVDTYLYPGCTVSPYYDSLMGKLITWGQNFEEARQRMTLAFLISILKELKLNSIVQNNSG